MEKSLRQVKLTEIRERETDLVTRDVWIRYKGERQTFNVHKIPLEYLVYNPYNGRIGSRVKTYEKEHGPLDPENDDHAKIIEKHLWEDNQVRNKKTLLDILENHQEQHGIVTISGTIIDGNRRAMLLKKIASNPDSYSGRNIDHCRYFHAIILPDDGERKELMRLETRYQMGRDEVVDYGPIEKYLKCKDLYEQEFEVEEIKDLMNEKKSQIEKWLGIMGLMDDYLAYLGYDGIYTMLEKTEDPLIRLYQDKSIYKSESGSRRVDWGYDNKLDVSELETICFDYIRSGIEGKEFRIIGLRSPYKYQSIFGTGDVWKSFRDRHFDQLEKIEEPTLDGFRQADPDLDIDEAARQRDIAWKEQADPILKENRGRALSRLEDLQNTDRPRQLLERALQAIQSVNTDGEQFYKDEVKDLVVEINRISWEYKKMIDRHR